MDRRVKERLVGASILAFLVVLIVPELLSGPAPSAAAKVSSGPAEQNRNVTIDLATRKPTSVEASAAEEPAASAAETPAAAPPPASHAAPSVVTMPAATPRNAPHSTAARADTPAPPPAPLERPAPAPTSTSTAKSTPGHGWSVQLGVFASRTNADKLARQLKAQGFPAYVTSGGSRSAPRYRVRVGPMPDRGAAAQTLSKLQAMGHTGALAAPGN